MNWSIGASETPSALGLSPYCSPYHWWAKKTGRIDNDESSEASIIGNALEDSIAKEFTRRFDVDLIGDGKEKFVHAEKKFIHARPDRFIYPIHCSIPFIDKMEIEKNEVVLLEIKTAGIANRFSVKEGDWGQEWTDQIPQSYLVQTQQQIDVINSNAIKQGEFCRRAIVFALIGDRGFVPFITKANNDVRDYIHQQLEEIVAVNLDMDIPLRPETEDDWRELADSIVSRSNGNKIRKYASNEQAELISEFFKLNQRIKEDEKRKAELRTYIMAEIGKDYAIQTNKYSALLTEGSDALSDKPRKIVDELQEIMNKFDDNARSIIQAVINKHTSVVHRGRVLRVTELSEKAKMKVKGVK